MLYAYFPTVDLSWEPYVEKWVWPVASIAQMSAVYLVVIITADRWWAICFPLKSKRTATQHWATIAVSLVVIWSVVFNAPTFLDMEVRWNNDTCRPEFTPTPWFLSARYQLIYKTILCFVFRTLLPLAVVIRLNAKLIQAIHKANHRVIHMDHHHSSNNINHLIAVVVSVFIICALPDSVYRILKTIEMYHSDILPFDWIFFAYFGTLTNLMLTINSSVNFLIYCVTGAKFRHTLAGLSVCRDSGTAECSPPRRRSRSRRLTASQSSKESNISMTQMWFTKNLIWRRSSTPSYGVKDSSCV